MNNDDNQPEQDGTSVKPKTTACPAKSNANVATPEVNAQKTTTVKIKSTVVYEKKSQTGLVAPKSQVKPAISKSPNVVRKASSKKRIKFNEKVAKPKSAVLQASGSKSKVSTKSSDKQKPIAWKSSAGVMTSTVGNAPRAKRSSAGSHSRNSPSKPRSRDSSGHHHHKHRSRHTGFFEIEVTIKQKRNQGQAPKKFNALPQMTVTAMSAHRHHHHKRHHHEQRPRRRAEKTGSKVASRSPVATRSNSTSKSPEMPRRAKSGSKEAIPRKSSSTVASRTGSRSKVVNTVNVSIPGRAFSSTRMAKSMTPDMAKGASGVTKPK